MSRAESPHNLVESQRSRAVAGGVDGHRRAVALGIPLGAVLFAAGCVSIGGGDTPARTWYRLEDRGGEAVAASDRRAAAAGAGAAQQAGDRSRGPAIDQVLLIAPVLASSFDESSMLAYSRAPGTRAHYQFAGWTEPPAKRIGVLVERRFAARGRLAAVAQSTAGVRGDLLLNLTLEDLYHDVSSSPGSVRVGMVAELVHWRSRKLLARRAFEQAAPVSRESAGAAVDGFNGALSALLDQLTAWVESEAQGAAAQG
jgi:cholesterol transport system auxiliary component